MVWGYGTKHDECIIDRAACVPRRSLVRKLDLILVDMVVAREVELVHVKKTINTSRHSTRISITTWWNVIARILVLLTIFMMRVQVTYIVAVVLTCKQHLKV